MGFVSPFTAFPIGALSFTLLMAVKVLLLEDDQQGWTARSLVRFWLTVPLKISSHAHRRTAKIFVPPESLAFTGRAPPRIFGGHFCVMLRRFVCSRRLGAGCRTHRWAAGWRKTVFGGGVPTVLSEILLVRARGSAPPLAGG